MKTIIALATLAILGCDPPDPLDPTTRSATVYTVPCCNADFVIEPFLGEDIVIVTNASPLIDAGDWSCDESELCTFDYGLVWGDDSVPLPAGGTTCEDSPTSCPGEPGTGTPPTPITGGGIIIIRPKCVKDGKPVLCGHDH